MNCLVCYGNQKDSHLKCLKSFFGTKKQPLMDYSLNDLNQLAKKLIQSKRGIPGVQPKLSLHLDQNKKERFTLVGLEGDFILKPPTKQFHQLPENEDLSMHLAEICGINVVPHTLIKLKSGELAYLTKRIDRMDGIKLHMEDMCQISGNLTEDKYRGSMEKIGKLIFKYSSLKGLDLISFFEITLFSYLIGNSDIHLKNFSLIKYKKDYVLSPAYDLLSVKLVLPEDKEEMALTLNGKKNKLNKKDFFIFGESIYLSPKTIQNTFDRFKIKLPFLKDFIQISFLEDTSKSKYIELLNERFKIFDN